MKDRIVLATSVDPEDLGTLDSFGGASVKNVVFDIYGDNSVYATQRPALQLVIDRSESGVSERGRGIYYWEKTGSTYILNDDTLYLDSYGTVIDTLSSGKYPVTFLELANYLVILDPENSQGWYMTTSNVLTEITDADFPSTLAGGGVVLNSVIYVMDEDGHIWSSGINDPVNWDALDVITAEREPDKGLYLGKIADTIVAIGSRTIEFFYDAANATGSPLSRRDDVSYREFSALDKYSCYSSGDTIYFLGVNVSGSVSLMKIENFKLEMLSTPTIDRYINESVVTDNNGFVLSGATSNGHKFIFMTEYDIADTNLSPLKTLCYDARTSVWALFETELTGLEHFPLIQWTVRVGDTVRTGAGIMYNGDIVRFSQGDSVLDFTGSGEYVEDGYWADGYVEAAATAQTANISILIRTQEYGGKGEVLYNNKFLNKLQLIGGITQGNTYQTDYVNIRWTDDHYNNYSSYRSVSLIPGRKIGALGKFNRRAFEITYDGPNRLRLESLELDYGVSSYA